MQDAGPPPGARSTPFREGAVVLVSLNNPREKFWGAILELTPAGLSIRGIDLNSLEDCARLVKAGEPVTAAAVFFPMQRIDATSPGFWAKMPPLNSTGCPVDLATSDSPQSAHAPAARHRALHYY